MKNNTSWLISCWLISSLLILSVVAIYHGKETEEIKLKLYNKRIKLAEINGRISAFEDIISRKCWLNVETEDIDCIEHIAE